MPEQIRVAIVDDHEMVREGFGALLNAQDDLLVVGSAADGIDAVELVRHTHPDVILMDIRMPRRNGLDAARARHGPPGASDRARAGGHEDRRGRPLERGDRR